MLRNAIVHIINEQPIVADLVVPPSPSDTSLICRNVRTTNGTKPSFVSLADSTFVLPVSQIRFVEIPATSYEEAGLVGDDDLQPVASPPPMAAGAAPPAGDDDGARTPDADGVTVDLLPMPGEEGLDGDLLRRIREA